MKKEIVFRIYKSFKQNEINKGFYKINQKLIETLEGTSFKSIMPKLKELDFDKIIYTNKRGTQITRIYWQRKLRKEVRIYPEKRTGKNDY